jgi:transposase
VARTKGLKKTNRYPDAFKIRAVELAGQPELLAKDVAEDLGIHPILLYRWRKDYREDKFKRDGRKGKVDIDTQKIPGR